MAKQKNQSFRASIRFYIDRDVFDETQDVLGELNLKLGDVITMLCTQIALHRKLPFEIKAREGGPKKACDNSRET